MATARARARVRVRVRTMVNARSRDRFMVWFRVSDRAGARLGLVLELGLG